MVDFQESDNEPNPTFKYEGVIIVDYGDGKTEVYNRFTENGEDSIGAKSFRDLFMKPEPKKKKTYWVNVWRQKKYPHLINGFVNVFDSKVDAKSHAKDSEWANLFLKTIKIKL